MNFEVEASRRVKTFIRKVKARRWLQTGKGIRSRVNRTESSGMWVDAKRSKAEYQLYRASLEKAAKHVFINRTLTRKDLEPYSKYTSALFGCLVEMFNDICRLITTRSGLLRLALRGIRVFLSGAVTSPRDLQLASNCGAKWALISYAYARNDREGNWLRYLQNSSYERAFIDSGAFTAQSVLRQPLDVQEYVEWIRKYRRHIFCFANCYFSSLVVNGST